MTLEKMMNYDLSRKLFERVDEEVIEGVRTEGCQIPDCGGMLHRSDYERKPRGFGMSNETVKRTSFCCDQEGCRKRSTPPSLRFLGRKVYDGVIVVLLSAMTHGLTKRRVQELREKLGIDRRTLNRWRQWWLESFTQSIFWKEFKGRIAKDSNQFEMPLLLVESFGVTQKKDGLSLLMKFLGPISVGSLVMVGVK